MSGSAPLHPIERDILKSLAGVGPIPLEKLVERTSLGIDQVRRGIEWLKFKNLVSIRESSDPVVSLKKLGLELKSGSRLPERKLVDAIKDGHTMLRTILESKALDSAETNAAISHAKRNGWISLAGEQIQLTDIMVGSEAELSPEERLVNRFKSGNTALARSELSDEEWNGAKLLARRPDYVSIDENKRPEVALSEDGLSLLHGLDSKKSAQRRLTPELITSGKWKEIDLEPLDVEAPAPTVFPGRSHPLVNIIDEVKEIFVGLGFEEIDGDLVQSGFWNFDALFIPQDHPAREMQDTFYVSGQMQDVPATREQMRKVADVHRRGWGSGWDTEQAKWQVLRTHATPVTLRHLATLKPDIARFFSVGRVFRNEKPSYKHLVEFNQVEGVATGPGLSLRDLMGLQKEFYAKMGVRKVKFWPTFFPYTEPSLQSMVYNERLQKWVELFGMGIFRPEVTHPLGIKHPVLAWGGGIERIAMLRFGIDDVRELYDNKLAWLRGVPKCRL